MDFPTFLWQLYNLSIFPLFATYLVGSLTVPYFWRRFTKPLDIKLPLLCYNIICSVLSFIAGAGMVRGILLADSVLSNTTTPELIPYYQLYANLKMLELLDTVFMILRHRTRQITFLHVFHHSSMLLLIQYGLQYSPWTALAPALAINSFVHVVMHFYYAYTVYTPATQRPSWKKRITELQIAQFLIDIVYCSVGLYRGRMCIWSLFYGFSMLVLFSNFYLRAYVYTSSSKSIGAKVNGSSHSQTTNGVVKKEL